MTSDDSFKILSELHGNTAQLDTDGALLVKGIESWIQGLVAVQPVNDKNEYDAIRMVDPETGALFAITRLKG